MRTFAVLLLSFCCGVAAAGDLHVAKSGDDHGPGTVDRPLLTIQAAADLAQPGDTITVHEGIYRERVNPPRGGASDTKRIIYQAAAGEKVVITGSERVAGWVHVTNDTWKVTIPNDFFGGFNPYAMPIHGGWFRTGGRHHRGGVYLNGEWLYESQKGLAAVLNPAGQEPLWFSQAQGPSTEVLLNVASFKLGSGPVISADTFAARQGTRTAPRLPGGLCIGYIRPGNWLSFDGLDFGAGTESVTIEAAALKGAGGVIELRCDGASGDLLGVCEVPSTGGWQTWKSFTTKITKTSGKRDLCMVFRSGKPAGTPDQTVIWAQFKERDPNKEQVEVIVRPTVFSPTKTGIDHITLRGFEICNAGPNWAGPCAGQLGLVSAYWCKDWIIEFNEIHHSRCSGIALGKYSDKWDGLRDSTAGYQLTINDALNEGDWRKDNIGSHVIRGNHIHHCEQTGIVGSLGGAFSRIEHNEIHDINTQSFLAGGEISGIKLHGAVDVLIRDNHIYRSGSVSAIWLDWMAQGVQITGNLLHDNNGCRNEIYCEVNHGPCLVANNIMLSPLSHRALSQGGAYVHNLFAGHFTVKPDGRKTPYFKPNSLDLVARHDCPVGDVRFYNNLLVDHGDISEFNKATWSVVSHGNVFTDQTVPSRFDEGALIKRSFNANVKLTEEEDGWYLQLAVDPDWAKEITRQLVTTESLGKARIPDQLFTNPDGSPLRMDRDYFGKKRNEKSPFPGPFEIEGPETVKRKVWPKSY